MAFRKVITEILDKFLYDENAGFRGAKGVPCIGCVSGIHSDVRCACVSDEDDPDVCVRCARHRVRCLPIPRELLGAAQFYWNTVKDLAARDPSLKLGGQPQLNDFQLWHVTKAIVDCGSAWGDVALYFSNEAAGLARLDLHAKGSEVEVQVIQTFLASGVRIPLGELRNRLNVCRPAYAEAVALEETLSRLHRAENSPPVETNRAHYLPRSFDENLLEAMGVEFPYEDSDDE